MAISEDKSSAESPERGVQDRLLDAAEQLFAEHGFDGTSIRDLAASAGCNIASVNYYFGGKDNLYVEIWRRHLLSMRDIRLESINKVLSESGGKPVLEDLLRSFARAFVGPLMDESGGRLMRLMAREMLDSHLPADMFGKEVIEPTLTAMQQALGKACPGLDASKVPLVVFSLVGQLLHTIRIKSMTHSINDRALEMFEPDKVIDHIVAFTAAAIRAYAGGKNE